LSAQQQAKQKAAEDAAAAQEQAFQDQLRLSEMQRSQANSDRMYGLDAAKFGLEKSKSDAAVKAGQIKTASTDASGLFMDRVQANLAPVMTTIRKAIAAGKYDEGLFQQQISRVATATASASVARYGKPGQVPLPGAAVNKVVSDTMAAIRSEHAKELAAKQAQAMEATRFHHQLQLRQTPTYADLHPSARSGGRGGRSPVSVDPDAVTTFAQAVAGSKDERHVRAMTDQAVVLGIEHGANTKTLQAIRATGAARVNAIMGGRPRQAGGGLGQP
jgi:hypothetical protein